MNKSFAEYLTQKVHKIPPFKTAQIFVKQRSVWFDAELGHAVEKEFFTTTWKPLNNKRFLKIKGTPHNIAFSLGNHSAIVVAQFSATTQDKKIAEYTERLDECFIAATSSYYAHHDELTGVLNRHGIKHRLEIEYTKSFQKNDEINDIEQQVAGNTDLILLSFDIDKFKSVNDTFGHDAGDFVLATFATKLVLFVKELEEKYQAKFIFGRPGGEEFDLIIIGSLSKKDRIDIIEQLLAKVRTPLKEQKIQSERVLAEVVGKLDPKKTLKVPDVVTASIGVAAGKTPGDVEKLLALYSKLRTDADTALYRAKADGRNCAIIYSEILSQHGRVTDFDPHAEVVQIDIGSKVGVTRGQVYAIYPSTINNQPERTSDSNEKKINKNVSIAVAKIKILNAHENTSEGILVERINSQEIPKGSRLKLIPHGSSLVLTHHSRLSLNSSNSISNLPEKINKHLDDGTLGAVLVLNGKYRKDDYRTIEQKEEELICHLRILLPSTSEIFSSYFGEVFVILNSSIAKSPAQTTEIIEHVLEELDHFGLKGYAGITQLSLLPENCTRCGLSIPFYCRVALMSLYKDIKRSLEKEKEERKESSQFFTEHTPSSAMVFWRDGGLISDAFSDYHNFRRYGFDSPYLDNQLALAIWDDEATEHYFLAESALKRAAGSEKEADIFKANLALFWAEIGKTKEAYNEFKKIEEYVLNKGKIYVIAYAKICLLMKNDGEVIDKAHLASILLNAGNANIPLAAPYKLWQKEVIAELKSGKFD